MRKGGRRERGMFETQEVEKKDRNTEGKKKGRRNEE